MIETTDSLRGCAAPAKLNLFLHVTGRRPDGYHTLQTVFQLIDWGDVLHFSLREDGLVRRLTDVPGVLDHDKRLIAEMAIAEAEAGIDSGMISGGMIPKVENCIDAVRRGARGAVILDGRVPHACLLELFTEAGPGTIIKP